MTLSRSPQYCRHAPWPLLVVSVSSRCVALPTRNPMLAPVAVVDQCECRSSTRCLSPKRHVCSPRRDSSARSTTGGPETMRDVSSAIRTSFAIMFHQRVSQPNSNSVRITLLSTISLEIRFTNSSSRRLPVPDSGFAPGSRRIQKGSDSNWKLPSRAGPGSLQRWRVALHKWWTSTNSTNGTVRVTQPSLHSGVHSICRARHDRFQKILSLRESLGIFQKSRKKISRILPRRLCREGGRREVHRRPASPWPSSCENIT